MVAAVQNLTGMMRQGLPPTAIPDQVDIQRRAAQLWIEFEEARTERLPKDYEWWVANRWYNGDTDVFLDRRSGQIYRPPAGKKRHRRNLPLNLTGHTIDLLVAKQMRARPTFDAGPGSFLDDMDRLAARGARTVMRFLWDKNELTAERRSLFLNRNTTGNAFLKVVWDRYWSPFYRDVKPCQACGGTGQMPMPPEYQAQMAMMQQQAAMMGQQLPPPPQMPPCSMCKGQGQIDNGRKPLGDVRITSVSPWEVWPIAGAKSILDGAYHAFPMLREDASAKYAIPLEELQPASAMMDETSSDFVRLSRMGRIAEKHDENHVWVIERWLPPLAGSETPRVTVGVGNQIVWPRPGTPDFEQGWTIEGVPPYRRVPIFHFRLRPVAEQFWSNGIVLDMIAANDFVNRTRASFHRHQQTMAYTKWFYEEGSIDPDSLTAEEGEAVAFRSAEPPTQRSPASMPQFYVNIFEMEMQHIPRLAGLQDIDQGKAPPNIEAYQALHFLAEQSETVHGPVYLEDERQWRAVASAALQCAVSKYEPTLERLKRIGGGASLAEMEALLNSELSDSVDVRVEIGSALAHSPALRNAQVIELVGSGILTPQEVRQRGLLDFGISTPDEIDDRRQQEAVAVRENQQIAQGAPHQQMILMVSQDHQVHLECHRRAALEAQMRNDMQVAMAFEQAATEHMQLMQQQMAPQPAPQGGGGAGGGQPPEGQQGIPPDHQEQPSTGM